MYCFFCYPAFNSNLLLYSIDIATKQGFRYKELDDAKIWVFKNASLCQGFANQVTNMLTTAQLKLDTRKRESG